MLLNVVGVLIACLGSTAVAQASTSSAIRSQTSTSSAPATTHTFAVGADGHNFTPHETEAAVGDVIEFRFYPQNHSVVRGEFGIDPCIPYELTGAGRVGWWSGFKPTSVVTSNPPTFRITINDTAPLWFYCSAPSSCFDGMVGVINPNSSQTFDMQLAYAQNATVYLSPGEYFPEEVDRTSTSAIPTPTGSSTVSTSSAAAAAPSGSHGVHLSAGAIAGIAIGGFAVLVLAAALLYMCGRQKTVKELLRHSTAPPVNHNSYQPASPGLSEVHYANLQKNPIDSRYSAQTYAVPPTETESYRSMSPPMNERGSMMSMPPLMMHNGQPIPRSPPLGATGYPSPMYTESQSHEIDHSEANRPYTPHDSIGPHELAVPSRNASTAQPPADRPFSWAQGDYAEFRRDEKIDSQLK